MDTGESRGLEELGFIKYSGDEYQAGVIDAGSAGAALTGLDEAIRFFNVQQAAELSGLEYELPVKTRAGSWEAVLLGSTAIGGAFALGYAKKAGERMAENDCKEIGLKDVLGKSLKALQLLAKIAKHTRRPRGWKGARLEPHISSSSVFVENEAGELLEIPMEFYKWYERMPSRLLCKMTSVVRKNRRLSIGISGDSANDVVTISEEDKSLFDDALPFEMEEEVLFPELEHGAQVVLEGKLIRGNAASNSVGLEYMGHVINCVPALGSIREYKPALFLRCRVEGQINRYTKHRFVADRRPTLIIERVVTLEADSQIALF